MPARGGWCPLAYTWIVAAASAGVSAARRCPLPAAQPLVAPRHGPARCRAYIEIAIAAERLRLGPLDVFTMGVAGILVGAVAAGNGWRVDLQTFNTRLETVMAYPHRTAATSG